MRSSSLLCSKETVIGEIFSVVPHTGSMPGQILPICPSAIANLYLLERVHMGSISRKFVVGELRMSQQPIFPRFTNFNLCYVLRFYCLEVPISYFTLFRFSTAEEHLYSFSYFGDKSLGFYKKTALYQNGMCQ